MANKDHINIENPHPFRIPLVANEYHPKLHAKNKMNRKAPYGLDRHFDKKYTGRQ